MTTITSGTVQRAVMLSVNTSLIIDTKIPKPNPSPNCNPTDPKRILLSIGRKVTYC